MTMPHTPHLDAMLARADANLYSNLQGRAEKMAASAKDGVVKSGGDTYELKFNQREWCYVVFKNGTEFIRLNTKTLSSAKSMLKDYL